MLKMIALPRMLILFQTILVLTVDVPFKQWQKDISKFVWQAKKPWVVYKVLQDTEERGGLGLPDSKLYFAVCLVWMKE